MGQGRSSLRRCDLPRLYKEDNMNQLLTTKALTMTSREIAELTGKRHDNVMRDIRTMLDDL